MNLQDALQEAIKAAVDRIAARGDVEELSIAVAVALACGDVETVNYIGDNHAPMFNAEQQAAFVRIKAQTPEILAAQQQRDQAIMQDLNNALRDIAAEVNEATNPLTEHLQSLNKTMH